MKILLTGSTGHIGNAILNQLLDAGHDVVAVVRNDKATAALEATGAQVMEHELTDSLWLQRELRNADALIHTASSSDLPAADFDASVIDSAIAAFAGTDKRFINTGGMWVYGNSSAITERSEFHPVEAVAWRITPQQRALDADIHSMLVVPSITYGHGRGIPTVLKDAPRNRDGAALAIGSGDQHMENVYVEDLAALYLAVLNGGKAGETYIATSGLHPTMRQVTEAAVGPDVPVVAECDEQSRHRLGTVFADALLLDQQASNAKARTELGWNPTGPSILDELATGSYAR